MKNRTRFLSVALCLTLAISGSAFFMAHDVNAASVNNNSTTQDAAVDKQGNINVNEDAATDGNNVTAEVEEALAQDFNLYALGTDYNNKIFSQMIGDVVNKNTVTYDKASELARIVNLGYIIHIHQILLCILNRICCSYRTSFIPPKQDCTTNK